MTFWVKVKHGLVKFKPVSMELGPIIKRGFTHKGNKDVWTYTVELNSIKNLKRETSGKLHLSVPIANIHNRIFKVYFKFGVKNIAQKSSLPAVGNAASSAADADNSDGNNVENNSSSVSAQASQSPVQSSTSSATPKQAKVKAQSIAGETPITSTDLAKYQVKPQTKSYADIALVNYPILETVLIFLLVDGVIVSVAIYLYRKERRN